MAELRFCDLITTQAHFLPFFYTPVTLHGYSPNAKFTKCWVKARLSVPRLTASLMAHQVSLRKRLTGISLTDMQSL